MDSLKSGSLRGLRFLERYTKTDMVYLTKGGFWLILGQIIASASLFLTSLAFANLLAPETYGIYKYVLSVLGMLAATTLFGMDSAVTQATARGFEGTIIPAFKEKVKWSTIGTFISLFIAIYYYTQGNLTLAISFCAVSIFVPFYESSDLYNSLLAGKKLFSTQTIYNVIRKLVALVSIVTTILLTDNVYVLLFVFFISAIIPNILLFFRSIKIFKKNDNVDPEALSYGKKLSGIHIITMILGELDKILVFQHVGAVDLAVYTLATAPTDQIKGLFKNINALAMPQFSQRSLVDIKKTIWRKVGIISLATGAIVLIYIALAPLFFNIFFPKYLASISYSQILAISLIPVIISGFIYTALESQKVTPALYKYNLYSNILNIIILFPLVYYFGIWGAVVSRVTTRTFTLGLVSILLKRA